MSIIDALEDILEINNRAGNEFLHILFLPFSDSIGKTQK